MSTQMLRNPWWLSLLLFDNNGIATLTEDLTNSFRAWDFSLKRATLDGKRIGRASLLKEALARADTEKVASFNEMEFEAVDRRSRGEIVSLSVFASPSPTANAWRSVPGVLSKHDPNYMAFRRWEAREIDVRNAGCSVAPSELCVLFDVAPGQERNLITKVEGVLQRYVSYEPICGLWKCLARWLRNPVAAIPFSASVPITEANLTRARKAVYRGEQDILPAFFCGIREEIVQTWHRVRDRLEVSVTKETSKLASARLTDEQDEIPLEEDPKLTEAFPCARDFERRPFAVDNILGDFASKDRILRTCKRGRQLRREGLVAKISSEDISGPTIPEYACGLLGVNSDEVVELIEHPAFFEMLVRLSRERIAALDAAQTSKGNVLSACLSTLSGMGFRQDLCDIVRSSVLRQIGERRLGERVSIEQT